MFDCETAYRSRKITKKTQRYANSTAKKETKKQAILSVLQYGPETVREIIAVLYKEGKIKTRDRNEVAPRITELAEDGIVEAFEQKKKQRKRQLIHCWLKLYAYPSGHYITDFDGDQYGWNDF